MHVCLNALRVFRHRACFLNVGSIVLYQLEPVSSHCVVLPLYLFGFGSYECYRYEVRCCRGCRLPCSGSHTNGSKSSQGPPSTTHRRAQEAVPFFSRRRQPHASAARQAARAQRRRGRFQLSTCRAKISVAWVELTVVTGTVGPEVGGRGPRDPKVKDGAGTGTHHHQ